MKNYFTIPEVAYLLNKHYLTIYRYIRNGTLEAEKVHKKSNRNKTFEYHIPRTAIEPLLENELEQLKRKLFMIQEDQIK